MKLYVYDHCPFCVRARMIFGLKNLPVELVVLANDDEATPIGLVGKKVVPNSCQKRWYRDARKFGYCALCG